MKLRKDPPASPGSLIPRNRYLLAGAAVLLLVGALQAADLIELPFGPFFSWLSASVLSSGTLNDFMARYGYASIFALMALESASMPVPSEVVLPLAGYFVFQGTLSFWGVAVASTVGSLAGALVDYFLAKWLGRPFVVGLLGLFRLHRNSLERAEAWFGRSAQWTVFASRFVPVLRTVISLPAGLFEMDILRFVLMTVSGCYGWSVILVYAGFIAGSPATNTFATSSTVVDGLSALVAAMSAAYIAYYAFSAKVPKDSLSPPSSAP